MKLHDPMIFCRQFARKRIIELFDLVEYLTRPFISCDLDVFTNHVLYVLEEF